MKHERETLGSADWPSRPVYGIARFQLIGWLGWYQMLTPGVVGSARPNRDYHLADTMRPAAILDGGKGPGLVAEVARSAVVDDLAEKLVSYRRLGACEYVVWRPDDRAVDWFVLRKGQYVALAPGADGILRSAVFPGLWLDPAALIARDGARLLAVAQQGHGTPEHTAFLRDLQRRGNR